MIAATSSPKLAVRAAQELGSSALTGRQNAFALPQGCLGVGVEADSVKNVRGGRQAYDERRRFGPGRLVVVHLWRNGSSDFRETCSRDHRWPRKRNRTRNVVPSARLVVQSLSRKAASAAMFAIGRAPRSRAHRPQDVRRSVARP